MTAIAQRATIGAAPRAVAAARALLAAALALAALSFIFLLLSLGAAVPDFWGFRGANALVGVVCAWMGYVIAMRRPRNPIGWCLLAVGLAASLDNAALEYATLGLYGTSIVAGAAIGAWVHDWIWVWYLVGITVVFLYFPDGELPGRRWRAVIGLSAAAASLMMILIGLTPGPLQTFGVLNPVGLDALRPFADELRTGPAIQLGFIALAAGVLLGAITLARRFVRTRGDTRQQLKWLAMSAVLLAIALSAGLVPNAGKATQVATIGAFLTVPITIAIAILRYRLYEIDTLINRAIVYGGLTAVLAGIFAASQEVLKRIFVGATGESSDAASVIALFIIATLFAPARSRLQKTVDARFHSRAAGAEAPTAAVAITDLLRELATMHVEGVLTDAEFAEKKKELLARL